MKHVATVILEQAPDGTFSALSIIGGNIVRLDGYLTAADALGHAGRALDKLNEPEPRQATLTWPPAPQVCADCDTPSLCRQAIVDRRIAKCGKMS